KQRALTVFQRAGNYGAGANPGAHILLANSFFGILPALARIPSQVENHAERFLRMLRVWNGKPKKTCHALSVSGMQVSTFINETFSGLTDKFRRSFREGRRLGIFCECTFVADIAH